MKRSYTLIFVPHTGDRHRKMRLSSGILKTVAILAGVTLIVTSGLLVHYFSFRGELNELRELRLGNAELKRQNLDYEVSVGHLNEKVASLEDFVMKLSVMAGMGDSTVGTMEGGVGGPTDAEFGVSESAYGHAKQELTRMQGELTELEERSHVLERFYEQNSLMLASTPSIWPVRGYFSSSYGYRKDPFTGERARHSGIDVSTPMGRPVVATADGVVLYAAPRGTYGNVVVIDHKFDIMTRYAHLSKFAVRPGARVKRGDVIGYVGNSGRSRAPHLHYEVWVDDRPVHPLDYVLEYFRNFDPRNRPLDGATGP